MAVTTVALLLAGLVGAGIPADAATTSPRVLLTGGAAEVSRTYTATLDGSWPAHDQVFYQWQRGDHDGNNFQDIPGATGQKYTLTDDDHWYTVKVIVTAMNGSSLALQKDSARSNWIMYNMAPPVLSGVPHVGQVIRATFGDWYQEWETTLSWRRTGVDIPGMDGTSYRARPADAGKEISLLAIGEYTYPNGVHPIDRYAARMRIRWGTTAILKGASRSRGVLRLTAIAYAAGANQSTVRGRARLYDGSRRVAAFWIPRGRKVVTLRHLSPGVHRFRMVFDQNPWFDASRGARSFRVR